MKKRFEEEERRHKKEGQESDRMLKELEEQYVSLQKELREKEKENNILTYKIT